MPRNSLKNLLGLFPYFFDKREVSNFYKSQYVTNEQFKSIYQSLEDTYRSFHLNKRLLIWKEQSEPYKYIIHFVASYPNLKSVKLYKNNNLIHTTEYTFEENISNFNYSYNDDTRNDTSTITNNNIEEQLPDYEIIPSDSFEIIVETYNEYTYHKGFPENDNILGDVYDHDISLDEIGVLCNVPRKKYINVSESDYPYTEPAYNNRLTEDDYHYMKRILEYNILYHVLQLPVLEIWKTYSVNASMVNRERLLLKLFDITQHPYSIIEDETTHSKSLKVEDWTPRKWEHKDQYCNEENLFGEFFFASANTTLPVKRQHVIFTFKFVNGLYQKLTDDDYVVDIYLDNEYITTTSNLQWVCKADLLDEYDVNHFLFIGRRADVIVGDAEIDIVVRGCNTADFYVKADSTSNVEDGSREHPFKTLEPAIRAVNGVKNLIAVFGEIHTNGHIPVVENCTILGCNDACLTNTSGGIYFHIAQDKNLTVQDMAYKTKYREGYAENTIWTNNNLDIRAEGGLTYTLDYGVLITDIIPEYYVKHLDFDDVTGIVSWQEYHISEFTKLSDFNFINTHLNLDDTYLSVTDFIVLEEDERSLNGPYVYLKDREELVTSCNSLVFNKNTGVLSFNELTSSDIVSNAKLHDILGA